MKLKPNNYNPNVNSLISSDFPRYLISKAGTHMARNVLGQKLTMFLC